MTGLRQATTASLRRRLLLGSLPLGCALLASCHSAFDRSVTLGFWFELGQVHFESRSLQPPLAPPDFATIEATARAELVRAFAAFPVTVTTNPDARFRIRVEPAVKEPIKRMDVAGAARALPGLPASASVSFTFAANAAISHAPPTAIRDDVVRAIGRGIGRTAVHEFVHLLFPTARVHDGHAGSYEHGFSGRPEHYYGSLEWDVAWPLLQKRFGVTHPPR